MKKIKIAILFVIAILTISSVAGSMLIPVADRGKERGRAPENSPVIDDDWVLQKATFVHYATSAYTPKERAAPSCYKLLGVTWKSFPVSYVINPSNPDGLSEEFVTTAISTSAETWDAATAKELFNDAYSVNYEVNYGSQDFVNAIAFGDYPNDGVIAVTTIWYIPRGKQIVEFDVLFNTRFDWGDATADSTVMDLQNIATHEIGHGAGLNDIYQTACSEVTMYGYSAYGETKKRTLEQPDITGIQKIYG